MSTQGQGDVAQQSLEERVSQFHTCRLPGQAGIHMATAALIDDLWKEILTQRAAARKSQSHADRLRALLSSSRGEQGWRNALDELLGACQRYDADPCSTLAIADYLEAKDHAAEVLAAASSAPGSVPTFAGQAPDGYVLVPKEPTEVMINEAQMALDALEGALTDSNDLIADIHDRALGELKADKELRHDPYDMPDDCEVCVTVTMGELRKAQQTARAALRALGQQDTGETGDRS